ncbi:MAG: alpha-glucosidase/alpha-galactosidase [Oscillospiraceae bacterium]|nr:alpha-glucosidase/alpha-galactosidase [Oscillospiraceae bacterium]
MLKKDRYSFAFIGAGSAVFTLRLIGDVLREADIVPGGEFRLVDVSEKALNDSYEAVRTMVERSGRDFRVTRHTDFRDALPGLDFMYLTFVVGGFASWGIDAEICTRHGVLQSVGDTIGPGGIIRTLRNVPVVHGIAREMERVCPEAWIINYSNPEGALCLAIEKYTKIKAFGLCHGTPDTVRGLARHVFGAEPEDASFEAAGINHLTWITKLEIKGRDVYPELRERLVATGHDKNEPISFELFERFGLYPAPGDRHVGEFFSCYLRPRVLEEKRYRWGNVDIAEMAKWREASMRTLEKVRNGELDYMGVGGSGESSMHFVRSLVTGSASREMANVRNRGYIENVSDGIIVEVPVFVDGFGLHPQKVGRLPEGIAARCEALGREYSLAVEAAVTGCRETALRALIAHPLVGEYKIAKELFDKLLEANKAYLPQFFG